MGRSWGGVGSSPCPLPLWLPVRLPVGTCPLAPSSCPSCPRGVMPCPHGVRSLPPAPWGGAPAPALVLVGCPCSPLMGCPCPPACPSVPPRSLWGRRRAPSCPLVATSCPSGCLSARGAPSGWGGVSWGHVAPLVPLPLSGDLVAPSGCPPALVVPLAPSGGTSRPRCHSPPQGSPQGLPLCPSCPLVGSCHLLPSWGRRGAWAGANGRSV